MKRLLPLLGLFLAFALPAAASNCPSFPYTLTNGQTADANQVMANFNSLLNCANTTLLTAPVTGSSIASSTITASNIASGTLTSSQISTSGGVGLLGTAGTWTAAQSFTSGADNAVTQAVTDNSTLLATDAFVWTHGLQSAGQQVISTSTALGSSQAGANLLVGSASGTTITLPSTAVTYSFDNSGTYPVTLSFPSGSDFPQGSGSPILYPNEQVQLAGDGTGFWRTVSINLTRPMLWSHSANWTFAMGAQGSGTEGDVGSTVYHPSADTTARTWTIPANASVALPIGAKIDIINDCSAGVLTIAITSDTLVWFTSGGTGSRSLQACGEATLTKVGATRWIITGTGLS